MRGLNLQIICREDAPKVFRRYWDYTLPIRKFMADTSEEAVQVRRDTDSNMLLQPSVQYIVHIVCYMHVAA